MRGSSRKFGAARLGAHHSLPTPVAWDLQL
jgi:hypothetical protein